GVSRSSRSTRTAANLCFIGRSLGTEGYRFEWSWPIEERAGLLAIQIIDYPRASLRTVKSSCGNRAGAQRVNLLPARFVFTAYVAPCSRVDERQSSTRATRNEDDGATSARIG